MKIEIHTNNLGNDLKSIILPIYFPLSKLINNAHFKMVNAFFSVFFVC
jgi:hypothetical protein